ncbi:MAG: AEC family transporter [Lachnospiraceae bacterium]|nr:AEC family transporter [Lachnospiraceae bacterium]
MSIQVVASQMSVMFFFILVGYGMAKRGMLLPMTCKQISGLIVNVCSPALLLTSVLDENTAVSGRDVLTVAVIAAILFALQILMGLCMGRILHAPKSQWNAYNMMTVFGNLGFIGIPVALAVLGRECMIYAAVFNLIFNILVYTYGIFITTKDMDGADVKFQPKKMLNTGNIAAVLTIVIFFGKIRVPAVAASALQYMANAVTFLSVLVIGASVARVPLKSIFTDIRIYFFIILRMLAFPILTAVVMNILLDDPIMTGLTVLMVAMPAANMPLMMAEQYDQPTDLLSRGIVLSTLCSVITITITSIFV